MRQFIKLILKRKSVFGSSRDTGYRVYERYFAKAKSECVQSVFNSSVRMRPQYVRLFLNLKKGYYSKKGFKDLGYPDALSYGWDEFVWQGEPFGFHLQGARKDGGIKDHLEDLVYLKEVLGYFLKDK